MRTVIVLAIGVIVGLLIVWLRGKFSLAVSPVALFAILWGGFCIVDTWYGVNRAGYGLREEVMIHLAVFSVPVVAVWIAQKWL